MGMTHTFSRKQELASAISHGIGVAFSLVALILLIVFAAAHGSVQHIVTFTIYGSSMLLLYTCSTLLHSLPPGRAKDVFEVLDHSAIYLFIAGTYTPLLLIVVGGWEGWTLLAVVWTIALGGVVFKAFYVKRFIMLSTLGYLLMGWLAIFVIQPVLHTLPLPGVLYLFGGGLSYTLGTLFYVWRKFTYHHAVWHLFVLVGSVCHFILVLVYILPIRH